MKLVLLFFLTAVAPSVIARDLARQVQEYRIDLKEADRSLVDAEKRDGQLRARWRKLPSDPSKAARVESELEESKAVIAAIAERREGLRTRVQELEQELQTSPEHQVPKAIGSDKRRPTKKDISGVWRTGFNLTGYTMQVEQRGETVSGRGYHWGCIGVFGFFEIKGTYRNNVLSLTFLEPSKEPEKRVFRYYEERRRPRFRVPDSDRGEKISPFHEG